MRFLWKIALRSRNGDCFIENVLSINLFLARVNNLCFSFIFGVQLRAELRLWQEEGRREDNQYTQRWSQSIETTRRRLAR